MIRTWIICLLASSCAAYHYPIQFSIPESKIVGRAPIKDRDFAFITPKDRSTYIYKSEEAYYQDYQRSYFAVTCKKGGWDCMRHYEILANGCIPYFIDLDQCPSNTMFFLPKDLIREAMHLPGVGYASMSIDHMRFDHKKYDEILNKLLDYTRSYLTARAMAEYILKTMGYTGEKPILFLSGEINPDYLRCLSLIGLKQILGEKVVDVPKIPYLYQDYPGDVSVLYGRGMSYSKILDADRTDRSLIEQRIKQKEFGLIIYGSLHRGLPFFKLVQKNYSSDSIVYLCGEDDHQCILMPPCSHVFLREQSCLRSFGKPIIVLPKRLF
ncbi:MAG TPA: hypothetical protein DCE71_08875 [Parachlamydiales bacterium]|nr:hypothetical protein [Parachlamydiales bacterium]